jgi:glycerol-3-phosphate acyltransferase PlsY
MSPALVVILALAFGYLLGSIPFGLLLTKAAGGGDIRAIGSGNIGATNVLRTGRKGLAAATLLCDALKGTVAVLAAVYAVSHLASPQVTQQATPQALQIVAIAAGLGAFLGHLFPVWLKFKGGKGVATYIGLLIALAWPAAVIFIVVWLIAAWALRYSSLAALIASALTPLAILLLHKPDIAALFLVLTVLTWIMHRANIERLLNGTEGKIGKK